MDGRFKKGEHRSPATEFKKGKTPWIKGRGHSAEVREKMRQAKLKNPTRYWLGKKNPHHAGKNNVNWRGGISTEAEKIRGTPEYGQWRKNVFIRDKFRCRICLSNGYLNAHHIKPFSKNPELRTDTNNGIAVCTDCHKVMFKRENLFISFLQGILEKGLNSEELSQETTPSQQERLRKALWACVTVKGE